MLCIIVVPCVTIVERKVNCHGAGNNSKTFCSLQRHDKKNPMKKGSPNPKPEAWRGYYESRAYERMKVLNSDNKLKLISNSTKIFTLGDKEISQAL